MKARVIKYVSLLFASGLVTASIIDVLIRNLTNNNSDIYFVIPKDVYPSLLAIGIVWISFFFKRNIWTYLFLITLLVSFLPQFNISGYSLSFSIGSLEIDMITWPLLISHVLLNAKVFRKADRSAEEVLDETELKISYFEKQFCKKTIEELKIMDVDQLVPEAREAITRILRKV